MSSDTLLQLAQIGTILIGCLGIVVALRSHRRQLNAQMFIEFSSRFHNVLRAMPTQAWTASTELCPSMPAPDENLTKTCLQCFHIMADLYYLHKGGYISPDLWRPWQRGIKRVMQGPLLKREWLAVEPAFTHNPEFCRYVAGLID